MKNEIIKQEWAKLKWLDINVTNSAYLFAIHANDLSWLR